MKTREETLKKSRSVLDCAYESYVTSKIGHVTGDSATDRASSRRVYRRYLRGWLPPDSDAKILDLGCGHGNLLDFFCEQGYCNLEGVDRSPQQVARARRRFPQVVEGDALDYVSGPRGSYTLITAIDLLEHLTAQDAMDLLQACHEVLVPGGQIIVQTPNAAGIRAGTLIWGDMTHQQVYTPSSLEQLLELNGFQQLQLRETAPVVHGLSSLCRYVGWGLLATGARLADLVETGRTQKVYTRNMLARAVKARE